MWHKRAVVVILAACAAGVGAPVAAVASEKVPLTVDFGTARPKGHYPVSSGFPFARRALKDVRNIRILEGGKAVASQARKLAQWPDGSVKWALVDFLARPGSRYTLEYGAGVSGGGGGSAPGRMSASASSVSTGEVAFSPSQATGFFAGANGHGLSLTGLRNVMDMVHVSSPKDVPPVGAMAPGTVDSSQVQVDEFRLEESGPVKAVVLIKGKYRYRSTGHSGTNPFSVRLTAYRGFGGIMVQHTFIYDGVGDNDFCSRLGFDCKISLGRSRGTVTVGTLGGRDITWRTGDAAAGGLLQLSPDHFRVERSYSDAHAPGVFGEGARAAGWVDLSDGAKGLAVIHRNMRRRYPKATTWDLSRGRLTVSLWPSEAGMLDFRRYAREWGTGETAHNIEDHAEVAKWAPAASRGVASTHSVMFYFHEGSASAGGVAEVAKSFNQRPLAKAEPLYYAKTKALGPYAPSAGSAYSSIESKMAQAVDYYLENMERFRWYGVWDYGAFQQRFNIHKHGRWENDWGRWCWAQNDGAGRISHHLMMRYLCTGDRKFFDVGEAACRNNYDGDTIHTGKNYGLAHRHGVQHWSGPYTGIRGSCPTGPKILYYLSGDGRTRDAIETIARRAMTGYWEASGYISGGKLRGVDGGGSSIQACYAMWEMTGDEKYHAMIKKIIAGTPAPKDSWQAVCTTSFGLSQMIVDYYDMMGDAGSKRKTVQIAEACYNNSGLKKSYTYPGGYFRVFADAYRLTGDQKYKTYLEEMFGALDRKMRGTQLMPNTGRDLPYAYYAVMHQPEPEGSCR